MVMLFLTGMQIRQPTSTVELGQALLGEPLRHSVGGYLRRENDREGKLLLVLGHGVY